MPTRGNKAMKYFYFNYQFCEKIKSFFNWLVKEKYGEGFLNTRHYFNMVSDCERWVCKGVQEHCCLNL